MYKKYYFLLLIVFLLPVFVFADHIETPICGDGVVEEGEEDCSLDTGHYLNYCQKEGVKLDDRALHYQIGDPCLVYDRKTKKATNVSGMCILQGGCWAGGDRYMGIPSRVVVADKIVGLEEPVLVYIFDPGKSSHISDAYVKEVVEGPDHYLSNFCSFIYSCTERPATGNGSAAISKGTWSGYTYNARPGTLRPVKDFSNWFEAEPSEEDKMYWSRTTIEEVTPLQARRHGANFSFKKPGKYVVGIFDARGNNVESEPFTVCADISCEPTYISGIIEDGHGFGVPDLEIILTQDPDTEFTTHTSQDGIYEFNELIHKEKEVQLTFVFRGTKDEKKKETFRIISMVSDSSDVLGSDRRPVQATTKPMLADDIPVEFNFVDNLDMIESSNVDLELLDNFARTHYFIAEGVRFAKEKLNTKVNTKDQLDVLTPNVNRGSYYIPYSHSLYIGGQSFEWDTFQKPDNAEWHELSHAIMRESKIGGESKIPTPRHGYGEVNHLGYANPGTTDSFVEGFAVFLASVMEFELNYIGPSDNKPWIYRYGSGGTINMDDNLKPWDSMGRREDVAFSALLWDLYDKPNFYGGNDDEQIKMSIDEIWEVLNKPEIRDVKDIYDGLIKKVDETKLKKLFIDHGFFADKNGNKTHDEGEEPGLTIHGGHFLVSFDLSRKGSNYHDANVALGNWLLAGNGSGLVPAGLSGFDIPVWGSVDTDDDGDIAPVVFSATGRDFASNEIDKDSDNDFGPLTDRDGDGLGEMTVDPFLVLPYNLRRSFEEFPEEMLELEIVDENGSSVEKSYVTLSYKYDEPYSYRNYETKALISENKISIWVPESAELTMQAIAGKYESEKQTISHAEFTKNLVPRSDQGKKSFVLPASAEEIATALEKEKASEDKQASENADDKKTDKSNNGMFILILIVVAVVVAYYIYSRKRRS